jgi:hypothetical protein
MRVTGLACVIVCTILIMHSCTNVAPNDSVTWDVNYVVPLLKEKFTVSMLGLGAKNINDDSARSGDTLFISRNEQLYQQCISEIFTMPELPNKWFRGDLVIRKLKLESVISRKNAINYPSLHKRSIGVSAQKMFWRDTIVLRQVKAIEFGTTSEVLRAVVKNQSTNTGIRDISYSVISSTDTLYFKTIPFLAPQDNIVIEAGLDGFSVVDTIFIECSYVLDSVNEIYEQLLSFTAALDELHFSKATINDSLLDVSFVYEYDIPFGQVGFNASFVDIHSFALPFTINNTLPLGLKVNCTINSIWDAEYCRVNSIETTDDVVVDKMDSSYFMGDKITDINIVRNRTGGRDDISNHTIRIDDSRILPSWNRLDTINALHMSIKASIDIEGKMVTVENIERTGIRIGTPSLNLKAISGCYTSEKRIDNPSQGLPIMSQTTSSDIVKNFRNRLIPDRTNLDVDIKFIFPDDTRFENVDLLCRLFEKDSSDVLDSMLFSMDNVAAGKKYSNQVSFNRIIERLPDSLRYSLTYIIKPYKKIYLDNDVIFRMGNSFTAIFDAQAEMAMTMYLVWGILDTISFEFSRNAASFPLSSQNIALMKSKELGLSVQILNNSNITGRLRAVQANSINANSNDSVYLLGKNGLVLPVRGNVKENSISYNEMDVRSLTDPDSLSVKWIIDLFPCDIDALKDTDYIEINADLSLKGQHSTSSMFGFR